MTTDTPEDTSFTGLVGQATEQGSRLVRDELRLARAEITGKLRQSARGLAMLSGAVVVALYAVAALLIAIGLLLALVMPAWLAAVLVGLALVGVSVGLAAVGRGWVKRGTPPVPTETVRSVQADVAMLKERTQR